MNLKKTLSVILTMTILNGSFATMASAQSTAVQTDINDLQNRLVNFDLQQKMLEEKLAAITRYSAESGYTLYVDLSAARGYAETLVILLGYATFISLKNKASNKNYAYDLINRSTNEIKTRQALVDGTMYAIKDFMKTQSGERLVQTLAQEMIITRDRKADGLIAERAATKFTNNNQLTELNAAIANVQTEANYLRTALNDKELLKTRVLYSIQNAANEELTAFAKISANIAANQKVYSESVYEKDNRIVSLAKRATRATRIRNGFALGFSSVFAVIFAYDFQQSENVKWILSEKAGGTTLQSLMDSTNAELQKAISNREKTAKQLEKVKNPTNELVKQ